MKFNNYYTLSGLRFANVDSFEDIAETIGSDKIIAIDNVKHFKNYQLSNNQLIVFSDKQADTFMILRKDFLL